MARTKASKPDIENVEVPEVKIDTSELDDLMTDNEEPKQSPVLIKPTVGRMVLFNDGFSDQPCAAQIAYVHNDHNINIGYIDQLGMPQSKMNVHLTQELEVTCGIGECEWMEHQISNK